MAAPSRGIAIFDRFNQRNFAAHGADDHLPVNGDGIVPQRQDKQARRSVRRPTPPERGSAMPFWLKSLRA